MTPKRNRPLLTTVISAVALSTLPACWTRPSLVDYRPVVDICNTNMGTYEGGRTFCLFWGPLSGRRPSRGCF